MAKLGITHRQDALDGALAQLAGQREDIHGHGPQPSVLFLPPIQFTHFDPQVGQNPLSQPAQQNGSSLFGVGSLASCGQLDVELAGQEVDHRLEVGRPHSRRTRSPCSTENGSPCATSRRRRRLNLTPDRDTIFI